MGADFYPRLTAICDDDEACNRLVNEQAQIGLLLAGPGLLATLSLAPLVIGLFYSPQFHEAGNALRWICLGMMLRVVAWPIGFIIVAKGAQTIFFVTEVAAAVVHFSLALWLTPRFGATGAGAAYFGLYTCHTLIVYCIVRRLSGFRWSAANARLALMLLPAATIVFGLFLVAPFWRATVIGTSVTLVAGLYCLHTLARLLPPEALPAPIRARFVGMA
jgi:PST family polysaccharide transporter